MDAPEAYLAAEEKASDKTGEFIRKDGVIPTGLSVADIHAGLATVIAQRARLGDWEKWVKKREKGRAKGLGTLVEAL